IRLSDVIVDGEDICWIEGRPTESGRCVLVRRTPDGSRHDINPTPFNARTRVHDYGGGAATVHGGVAYYENFADQRLYRQSVRGAAVALTPAPNPTATAKGFRYADGVIDAVRNRWIGVREDHTLSGPLPVNTLVDIDLTAGGAGRILTQGNDFYSSPKLSPDGTRLAWLTWNFPEMPWDGSELWVAEITDDGTLRDEGCIAGSKTESIFQPEWSPDGILHFVSDRTGWWNLYRVEPSTGAVQPLCPDTAEFGRAQWGFGMSTYTFLSPQILVCCFARSGTQFLGKLDLRSLTLAPIETRYTEFGSIHAAGGCVVCIAGSPTDAASVVLIDPATGRSDVLQTATAAAADPDIRRYISAPRHVEFPTGNGQTAHGLYYAPFNPDVAAPPAETPPLLVKCHGGPTASASGSLDLRVQYWTSRGIAVLDVDYRGSTGYGRAYRDQLHGQWGVTDVDDCINGARFLIERHLANRDRVVITGGSAGGYTTLCALAFRDFFKAGGSHYGVGDLEALARDTHKFESRYLDRLIGPYPAQRQLYRDRSPVYHAEGINTPVIFFQGDQDRVVPPEQTEAMVEALRSRNIPVGYFLFANEQHGFRQAANIKRALDAELYFYATLAFSTRLSF
ncbi:MAG: S9 family peptidase, partial [Acetobacteraceae bacterium]